jgi:PAS domain S-box-containing protein
MAVMGLYLGAIVAEWATALGGLAADIAARVIADGDRRVVDAERLLLKESLSADRARLAALLECSHDAIVIMSPDGLMAYVSDAITRLTGRDRAGLLGKSILEHVHPDDISLARLSFADCLAHPTLPTKAEFRLITAAGHWVWLEALATNHLSNTVIAGVLINFRDVTERRAAERRLEEARTLLEATGRIAQIGGWEYIVPEDRLVWSEQTYRIHDLDRMTIKPTIAEALEFYEPSARPIIRDALDQGLKKGLDWNLVLPLISASGRRLWVNAIGQVETRAGQPYRLYGTIQDVTARIEANRAIERSESRYKNLFETAPVAIWEEDFSAIANWFNELRDNKIIDLGSYLKNHPEAIAAAIRMIKVRDVNQAAVTMNRASDKADLIANMQRLFTADSQGLFAAELVSFWNGERTLRLESRSVRLSGEPADVVLHLRVPEVDGQPDFSRVVVIALDVTEQKSLEDQLRQAQKLEAIGRLAGGVAHDFNNLLTVINGFAELILADAPAKSGIRDLAGHIRDAGRRAATLTRQLLAFSRKQPPTAKLVDVAAVVAGIRPLLSTLAGDDVRLVTQLDPVLPVKVDRAQLESAIMNLAVNARDAMPHGGTLTVSASLKIDPRNPPPDCPPTRWVMLSVSDTGTGIPEEVRKHLFEPFFTTKEVGKGTGLGLSTVYGIVTTAGGSIRYETAVGAGTTFHIYLPATEAEWESDLPTTEAAVATPAVEFEKTPPARLQTRPVVLLVEDQTDVRALSVRVLESAGYPVIEAESGPMALAKLAKVPVGPFVLVTDILMPRMNGRELASQVRAIRPDVAVLLMSGYAPENILANDTLVDEAFLAKPFSPEELLHAVSTLALAITR